MTIRDVVVLEAGEWNAALEIYEEEHMEDCLRKTDWDKVKVKDINGEEIGKVEDAKIEDGKLKVDMDLDENIDSNYFAEMGVHEFHSIQEVGWGSL